MPEKAPRNKPELTESRRQALEDLRETLVNFLSADLSEELQEKVQELIDAAENETSGNGDTKKESGWKIE